MGTIKFEVEVPDFESEISINVTIKRDGKVITTNNSTPSSFPTQELRKEPKLEQNNETKKPEIPTSKGEFGGNMMNLNF